MKGDEDLLIQAARRGRGNHRSGRNLIFALVAAAACAAAGWVLIFRVRAFIRAIPFLPLGGVSNWLLLIGVVALVLAAAIVVGAVLVANPRKRWGDPVVGPCPDCGNWTLRQDVVTHAGDPGSPGAAPKGVVTLCDTRGCRYASATVTTASRAG
jgi:hypothetical protein